jgi:hypothetical protein
MRQLGNAVPVLLARAITERIHAHLLKATALGDVIDFEPLAARRRVAG